MKKLTCELCGSNDFVKEDGLFVCQSCGTKYSVEEARKLMIEGTVEVTGTVQVDNTTNISNFLSLAEDALEKKDLEAVNDYIKRILEMNPRCTEARLIQFDASILAGDDKEIIKTGKSAIKFASDDDKARVESKIYFYFAEKAITITKTAINLLQWTYSNEESIKKLERLCSKAKSYLPLIQTLDSKIDSTNAMLRGEQDSFMYLEAIPAKTYAEYSTIKDKAENWLGIRDEVLSAYYNRHDAISALSEGSYHKEEKIIADWNIQKQTIKNRLDEANQILVKERKNRITQYWAEHAEEKAALESEKAELNQEIKRINETIQQLPETKEYISMEKDIGNLYSDIDNTGAFDWKRKKELKEKLKVMDFELSEKKEAMNKAIKPYKNEMAIHAFRIKKIDEELNKNR